MMSFDSYKLILLFQHLRVFCNSNYFVTKGGPPQSMLTEASPMSTARISLGKVLITSSQRTGKGPGADTVTRAPSEEGLLFRNAFPKVKCRK